MDINQSINLNVINESIQHYTWPMDFENVWSPLHSLDSHVDFGTLRSFIDTFDVKVPIYITIISKEYLKLAKIWISNINTRNLQIIIFCADDDSMQNLVMHHKYCCRLFLKEPYNFKPNYKSKSGFTTKGLGITAFKYPLVKYLIEHHFNVFLVDVDALLIKSLPHDFFNDFEIAFQRVIYFPDPIANVWKFTACSGFVWFKSCLQILELLDEAIQYQSKVYSDQIALNCALWDNNIQWEHLKFFNTPLKKFNKQEKIDFFINNHANCINGISFKRNLRLCALPTNSYWRNDFYPIDFSKIIVFHPNSPKSEIEKLSIYRAFNLK